ncbi:MAG: hypothetical protein IRZ06_01295 [Nevskia sp.]|nr:hypothetical protein [Nevskia sp.]
MLAAVFTHTDPNGNQSSNLSTIIPLRNVLADANAAAVLDPGKTGATMAAGYASTGPYIAYSVNGVPNKVTNYAYVGFHTGKFGITFDWTTQNADSCQASGAWSGPQPVSGSYHIPADTPAGDYFYYLTCTQASTGLQIQGYAKAHVMPPNSVDISVSPSTIMTGQTATLSWQQVGDNGICNASGDWSGSQPLSGSMTVGPFSQPGTHVYTLTCEGSETASNSATLTVTGTGGGSSGGSSSGGSSGGGSSSGGSGGSPSSGGGAVDPGLLAVLAGLLLLRLTPRKQEVRKMIRTISFALALAAVGFEPEASAQSPTVPGQDPADQAWKGPSAVTPHGLVKVCPQVALRCPDGSFTGYQGPNCELVPCPAGTDKARKAAPDH